MFYRMLLSCGMLALLFGAVPAQSGASSNSLSKNSAERGTSSDSGDDVRIGRPEQEMIRKRQLEFAKKSHQEHLARAHETALLGASLRINFAKQKTLVKEDYKKLEKLGKLAKKVREQMSDESDATPLRDNLPFTLEEALTRLDVAAQDLDKVVIATPRMVISALIIEKACEVEALARYINAQWPAK